MTPTLLAVDVGFASSGLAAFGFQDGQPRLLEIRSIRPLPPNPDQKRRVYQSHLDAERVQAMARGILDFAGMHAVTHLAVELPVGGGKSAMAVKAMALASGMIAALAETRRWPAEWCTPFESRRAATGKANATKDEVVAAMAKLYPKVAEVRTKDDREACADALATFEAVKNGQMVRGIQALAGGPQ